MSASNTVTDPATKLAETAKRNLDIIKQNQYPGRGLAIGLSETGAIILVYLVTGRSEGSRNRILKIDTDHVYTEVADSSKEKGDPALTIYDAMATTWRNGHLVSIVSNGRQTVDAISSPTDRLVDSLSNAHHEPDAPNFTPRISGKVCMSQGTIKSEICMHLRSPFAEDSRRIFTDIRYYQYNLMAPGFGHFICTYAGNGSPLPSFAGDPMLVPFSGTMQTIAQTFWNLLPDEYRVAVAVRQIEKDSSIDTHIINAYQPTK